MFLSVEFNTKEKMEQCYKTLISSGRKNTHTFYFISPEKYARETKYWVFYLPIY